MHSPVRRPLAHALLLALCATALPSGTTSADPLDPLLAAGDAGSIGLEAFSKRFDEPLVGVIVELDSPGSFVATQGKRLHGDAAKRAAVAHHATLRRAQDAFIARASDAGVPLLLRRRTVDKLTIEYRMSYLMDGFVAYVPASKLAALAALPGVRSVARPAEVKFHLDNSVSYVLGSEPLVSARRLAVYGATEELSPAGGANNGPADVAVDGYEGQGINIGVVDSGLDYEHPMFGGSGVTTPSPQRPPLATGTNRKVTYWYNLGGAATLDDFGHGTHVASTAAGYVVDGATPSALPTGSLPYGPTPGGVRMHGVAPQAKLMGWPVCNAAGNCTGDIELAIEDAVSPVILTGQGDGSAIEFPGAISKPVADVVNLSLGGGNDPAAPTSRVSNTAVLSTGAIIVAAAGNDGPGEATVGAPCVGTLVICVGSVLDPGSGAATDVLAAGETTLDLCANTNNNCAVPAPAAETGAASNANATAAGERVGMRTFRVAGGGELAGASVSSHVVYVDRDQLTVPSSVTGRIALLENGIGAFATIVNPVAALDPKAILLISDTESATALVVLNGVPTYTVSPDDGAYLKSILLSGGAEPSHGAVSRLPLRVSASATLADFEGAVSGFSSRGPNAHPNGDYRTIKPDVAAPGQGILAATTPTGTFDFLLGMANASGYTIANGTSMASPHVAGAAALVRQRLRALGLDTADVAEPDYRAKRFRAATIARAMLTNTATDLRTGLGAPPAIANPAYTINDVGAGVIDIDAALRADAIMTSLTKLHDGTPDEFTAPATGTLPLPVDAEGNVEVPIPTASFGNVEVVGSTKPVVRDRLVTIEDITGDGDGSYALAVVDDQLANRPDIDVEFRSADGNASITSVAVPANGSASFIVRTTAQGDGALIDGTIATWYVHATHAAGKRLRMPFLYRAVRVPVPMLGVPDAPTIGSAGPANAAGCAVDPDNAFTVDWAYTPSSDALAPIGYRLQRGRVEALLFEDDASEPLVAGSNSTWTGTTQWLSLANPNSGDGEAYFVGDNTDQNETLTLTAGVAVPSNALGASVRVTTTVDTEAGFDFANFRANANGGAYQTLARISGQYSGELNFDANAFAGTTMGLQFAMTSDQLVPGVGWWVDSLAIFANDYALLADVDAATTSVAQSVPSPGVWRFRVAGRHDVGSTEVLGPYTASACACVPTSAFGNLPADILLRDSFEDDGSIVGTNCQ